MIIITLLVSNGLIPTLICHELWILTERARSWIQAAEISFLLESGGHSLRNMVELCHLGGARSRAIAPPHRDEPTEVTRASVSDVPWTPP